MRSISVSAAKNSLSALLQEVRGGASIVITDRGVPVAQLAPVVTPTGVSASAIELAQQGRLILPAKQPDLAWLELPIGEPTSGASAVQALLDEREESR